MAHALSLVALDFWVLVHVVALDVVHLMPVDSQVVRPRLVDPRLGAPHEGLPRSVGAIARLTRKKTTKTSWTS